jgi:hypothetical protein
MLACIILYIVARRSVLSVLLLFLSLPLSTSTVISRPLPHRTFLQISSRRLRTGRVADICRAAVLAGDDCGLRGAVSRSLSVGFRVPCAAGIWLPSDVPTGAGTGSLPSVDRTSSVAGTGSSCRCTLATSVAKTAPSCALCPAWLPKLSRWVGLLLLHRPLLCFQRDFLFRRYRPLLCFR